MTAEVVVQGADGELITLDTTDTGTKRRSRHDANIADGADVAQGATADAVVAAGAAGTVSAKLRRLTTDLGGILSAEGTTGDAAYTSGAGTVIALLKGIFARLRGGQATMANSLPVVLASDQAAIPVTGAGGTQYDEDTAHVSGDKLTMAGGVRLDTAASLAGTDGDRTTFQFDSIGQLRVNPGGLAEATDSVRATAQGSLTNRSGTIAAGGTAQQAMAANTARRYLLFVNVSDTDMWINLGATAVANQPSILVKAGGGSFVMEGSFVSTELVSVICATTGKAFTAKEG